MTKFIEMLSYKKGDGNTHFPVAGDVCLVSPPNCDNEDGYVYGEMTCLWADDKFALFRVRDCWPNIYKLEHIRCKPLPKAVSHD